MAELSVKIDDNVKIKAEKALGEIGMSLQGAVEYFLTKVASDEPMQFEFYEELNEETIEVIRKAEQGIDVHGPFDSIDELMESLNA